MKIAGFDVELSALAAAPASAHGRLMLPALVQMVDRMEGQPFRVRTVLVGEFVHPPDLPPVYLRVMARQAA